MAGDRADDSDLPARPLAVEILHTEGCGHWEAARDRVVAVAGELGAPISVTETPVATAEDAVAHRFPGSPTVRVEGRDVQPGADDRRDFGLG